MSAALNEEDIEAILAALRAGGWVQTPGSRCHSTYYFENGQWWREDFDEGATTTSPCDERSIRTLLAEQPALGMPLLRHR